MAFCGPYGLSVALQSCVDGVPAALLRRMLNSPSPRNYKLALRRVQRTASELLVHESTELFAETLGDSPLQVLNAMCLHLFFIASLFVLLALVMQRLQSWKWRR